MVKTGKVQWPTCPHCNFLINSWDAVPMSALMTSSSVMAECPVCDNNVELQITVTTKIEMFAPPDYIPKEKDNR